MTDFWTNHFNIYEHKVFTPQTREKAASELAFLLGQDQREVIRKNSLGMELVWIPPGNFMMGSSESEIDEALYECKKYYPECKRDSFTYSRLFRLTVN